MAVGGAAACWFWWRHRRATGRAEASRGWPEARGLVTASQVDVDVRRDRGGSYTYYIPVVRYTYSADGQEYHGSRLRFGKLEAIEPEEAAAWIAPYPVGAAVTVRYNPNHPAESVLEPGKVRSDLFAAWVCAGIFVLGLIGFLRHLHD